MKMHYPNLIKTMKLLDLVRLANKNVQTKKFLITRILK